MSSQYWPNKKTTKMKFNKTTFANDACICPDFNFSEIGSTLIMSRIGNNYFESGGPKDKQLKDAITSAEFIIFFNYDFSSKTESNISNTLMSALYNPRKMKIVFEKGEEAWKGFSQKFKIPMMDYLPHPYQIYFHSNPTCSESELILHEIWRFRATKNQIFETSKPPAILLEFNVEYL